MDSELWSRIERTQPQSMDPERHASAITDELVAAGVDETLRWAEKFDQAMDTLYDWQLWGVAYYALGGCSDDSFEYLRAWLIGRGEDIWSKAKSDPEGLFVSLLQGATDPNERWDSLRIHEGEPLLYCAGVAHERLTGEWLPASRSPDEPAGDEWEEDDLPNLFPRLESVLPDDWWSAEVFEFEPDDGVLGRIQRGLVALAGGDHRTALDELGDLVTDGDKWSEVPDILRTDVAYGVGITHLVEGRLEEASGVFGLVADQIEDNDALRRAMAQVALARGDLAGAERLIDGRPERHRLDRVLAAKLAFRRGDRETAIRLAREEIVTSSESIEHPWDVAGAAYQAGAILVELGAAELGSQAADLVHRLLEDAPPDLPLVKHLRILRSGVLRLSGEHEQALIELDRMVSEMTGGELAEVLRERARILRALDRTVEARQEYLRAKEAFESVGESWEAEATTTEAEDL